MLVLEDERVGDAFVQDLRAIDGVPKTDYEVEGERVFVFGKLVSLVSRSMRSGVPLGDLARSLVPAAHVPPLEAVRLWRVKPKPFVGAIHPGGLYAIRHEAFDAWLPGRYRRELDMQRALADLLMGKAVAGEGDFVHHGQAMSLCEPLSVDRLAPRPPALAGDPPGERGHALLRRRAFVPGFEPLSEALFQEVRALDSTWASWWAHASAQAVFHAPTLWAMLPVLDLAAINGEGRLPVSYGSLNDLAKLREVYPELAALSDANLMGLFDSFVMGCDHRSEWEPYRDDGFLSFLLGMLANPQQMPEEAMLCGRWVGHALLREADVWAAMAEGRAAMAHWRDLRHLVKRVDDALRFLALPAPSGPRRGPPVRTLAEAMDLARSLPVAVGAG